MNITPYIYKEDKRIVDKSSYLTQILPSSLRPIVGTMREPLDVLYPVVTLDLTAVGEAGYRDPMITSFNYAYIQELGRYYYARKKEVLNNLLLRVYFEVDPLFSHKSDITALTCVVSRNAGNYDPLIADDIRPLKKTSSVTYTALTSGANKNLTFDTEKNANETPQPFRYCMTTFISSAKFSAMGLNSSDIGLPWDLNAEPPANIGLPKVTPEIYQHETLTPTYVLRETRLRQLQYIFQFNNQYLDYVIGIVAFPFRININMLTQNDYTVAFGDNVIGSPEYKDYCLLTGCLLPYLILCEWDMPTASSFLDYSPYADYEVFVPFYGWIKLPYEETQGHKLMIYYSLSALDGAGNANVYDETAKKLITSVAVQVGTRISLNTTNFRENQNERASEVLNSVLGLISAGAGVAMGNPIGVGVGLGMVAKNTLQMSQIVTRGNVSYSKASSGGMSNLEACLRVTKKQPTFIDSSTDFTTYAKENGLPLNQSVTLSSLTGYTVIDNPILSGFDSAMESEKGMIRDAMRAGIIL